ncbi:Peptidoglycan/LPS O-acetylase OafA/YrhL, contains acyltransferase and SGNH-hydrolase domains [Hymenobacter daecheongensis DSM 21074]|uniref:Peptidoglycan/LPS O-acetylase OafA/YrhL, contains acyltransferase and SGNH-hydrolase domains n=1 Tax=Hymenobacter daecheongensis DSM 21074 TaxID=1121955 RepID=A0A1M6CR17_9BACT|nr:acyltransferase [Hymenobacter daecheongensis]SHI63410.1 Peptidoglycan/LPS O-acetylase OafA/YrhL, contains acyltransferase and SGNH-hydrolase domains [Hymenobacter daecheongensis DSM 21074]
MSPFIEKYTPFAGVSPARNIDANLEALRGIAAFLVVFFHYVDPSFKPTGAAAYTPPGHLSVLIFFILSGYVIGLAYMDTPITPASIVLYLRKRLVRLVPIYLICMVLTLLVATHSYSAGTLLSNFTFGQVLFSPVILENEPIWSLNFEVLFYLLFIPISLYHLNPLLLLLAATLLGVVSAVLYPSFGSPLLSSYAFGFSYWLMGLCLAQYLPVAPGPRPAALMLSSIFLLLAIGKFNVVLVPLQRTTAALFGGTLNFPATTGTWYQRIIEFEDYAYLPFCLLIVFVFTRKTFPGAQLAIGALILAPSLTFIHLVRHPIEGDKELWLLSEVFYLIALALYVFQLPLERLTRPVVDKLLATGALSYGLYLVHYPIRFLFDRFTLYQGTALTYSLRYIVYLVATSAAAYWLEKKFQPWVRARLL